MYLGRLTSDASCGQREMLSRIVRRCRAGILITSRLSKRSAKKLTDLLPDRQSPEHLAHGEVRCYRHRKMVGLGRSQWQSARLRHNVFFRMTERIGLRLQMRLQQR